MKEDSIKKLRRGGRILLGIYLACLVYFMFFSESYGRTLSHQTYRYNLVPFKEIQRFLKYRHLLGNTAVFINIVGNVAVFIPLGCAVPALYPRFSDFKSTLYLSFFTSLTVELLQLFSRVGCFDVDDLLLNTIGGCLGYLLFAQIRRWRKNGKKSI